MTLVSAIARVLSSQILLAEFDADPKAVAKQLRLAEADRDRFVALDPLQLRHQAETLLVKRWHEVCQLAPQTIALLGDGGLELFRYYAGNCWPAGHRRHPIDALQFFDFLAANRIMKPPAGERRQLRRMLR